MTTQLCTRCIMDASVPGIRFDAQGVCNYCHIHDRLLVEFPTGEEGARILQEIAAKIRKAGKGRKYDCVVGVSGGRDTSYCLYYTKEIMNLRPLAVHFDNGWDSETAKTNLSRVCDALDVDLHTIIMDWPESRELTNCTIRACVPYIDLTDDVGIASALYRTAAKENVRYIILSHSFREEGITPLAWNYMDARYTRALIKRFCAIPLVHFKNVDIHHMLYWSLVKGIRIVNITNYYDDTGDKIEKLLTDRFGWIDTGQHHMDNEMFALVYYYARHKFGFDWRIVELAAKVRTGVVSRDEALQALQTIPFFENEELVNYCLKKQGFSREEFDRILAAPNKYFYDYPTYYPLLRFMRLPIKLLCRAHVFPAHAYEKYFEAI
ncbi:MAG TPA: N-acetyl sugar amidotransferase [Candidatus Hydrogenedentes bacterium]|nr:N-acetyl sugar amidotransferase [Candidatus Hydrogenedentota bacterium]HPC17373.1 N-acetyl sugar amidotransferase [Candidatus Hydrogenedentota bacterium]HRT20107.1 N-acetyl sugar amidotransferase [Candidatus Hydrogenedentota bacterium]HRT64829.1 N-acetyl sugar amidotransferase [Candidatus Hydrogenedentota bacterium]